MLPLFHAQVLREDVLRINLCMLRFDCLRAGPLVLQWGVLCDGALSAHWLRKEHSIAAWRVWSCLANATRVWAAG